LAVGLLGLEGVEEAVVEREREGVVTVEVEEEEEEEDRVEAEEDKGTEVESVRDEESWLGVIKG
jgi:hypothetical protein